MVRFKSPKDSGTQPWNIGTELRHTHKPQPEFEGLPEDKLSWQEPPEAKPPKPRTIEPNPWEEGLLERLAQKPQPLKPPTATSNLVKNLRSGKGSKPGLVSNLFKASHLPGIGT